MGHQAALEFKKWLLPETLALAGNYKGGVFMRLVAASYKLAPVSDPAALAAFQELQRKMSHQNDFLRHAGERDPDGRHAVPRFRAGD